MSVSEIARFVVTRTLQQAQVERARPFDLGLPLGRFPSRRQAPLVVLKTLSEVKTTGYAISLRQQTENSQAVTVDHREGTGDCL
jgi:hypothetical protein